MSCSPQQTKHGQNPGNTSAKREQEKGWGLGHVEPASGGDVHPEEVGQPLLQ